METAEKNGDCCKGWKWGTGKNKLVTTKNKAKPYRRKERRNIRDNMREKAYAKNNS